MGKDKSAQRTKGNLKPSSSGRSAEVLGGVNSFVGFGNQSSYGFVPAAAQTTIDNDSQLPTLFRVTLRKMSKKDSVTKIKGLQEFEKLCMSEDAESIKACLAYWPRIYQKLVMENDIRVREFTQLAHSTFVNKVGKNLAPHLRIIMPVWLFAMADPHAPTAVAASNSFQMMFSEEKRSDVMVFCFKEIIDFVSSNLFSHQSTKALSSGKDKLVKDPDGQISRNLFSSLKMFSMFLDSTAKLDDKKSEVGSKIVPLIQHEGLWKLAKHETVMVKSSWFGAMKSLFNYDTEILLTHSGRLFEVVFSSLDLADSAVLPHVWITFILLCTKFPEFLNNREKTQAAYRRMFSVVNEGGRGSLVELAPLLLPIIKIIPQNTLQDSTEFYANFFGSLTTRLRDTKTYTRNSDFSALTVAFCECLKHLTKKEGNNEILWEEILSSQVVSLLHCFIADCSKSSGMILYKEISKLFFFLNGFDVSGQEKMERFWIKMISVCETLVSEGEVENFNGLKSFFGCMNDQQLFIKPSRQQYIEDNSSTSEIVSTEGTLDDKCTDYFNFLSMQIAPFIKFCLETYRKHKRDSVLDLFVNLVNGFSSEYVYKCLVDHEYDSKMDLRILFINQCIGPLFAEDKRKTTIEISVSLMISVYGQISSDNQLKLLSELEPSLSTYAFKLLITKLLEDDDVVARSWFKSASFGDRIFNCNQKLTDILLMKLSPDVPFDLEEYNVLSDLVSLAFNNASQKRQVFSSDSIGKMLSFFDGKITELESKDSYNSSKDKSASFDDFIQLIVTLVSSLLDSCITSLIKECIPIAKHFYRILYQDSSLQINKSTRASVKSCFLQALEKWAKEGILFNNELLFTDKNSLVNYILFETKTLVLESSCNFGKALHLADLVERLLLILMKWGPSEDCAFNLEHSLSRLVISKLLPTDNEWTVMEAKLSSLYMAPTLINGSFISRNFVLPLNSTHTPPSQSEYQRITMFILKIILSMCVRPPITGACSSDVSLIEYISLDGLHLIIINIFYAACYSGIFLKMNEFLDNNENTSDVRLGSNELIVRLEKLLQFISNDDKTRLIEVLINRCSSGDISWCVTLRRVLKHWIEIPIDASKYFEDLKEEFKGSMEVKQILLPYMDVKNVLKIITNESESLVNMIDYPLSSIGHICLLNSTFEHLPHFDLLKKPDDHDIVKGAFQSIFDVLTKWREMEANVLLLDSNMSGDTWKKISLLLSIMRLLRIMVKRHSLYLVQEHWDLILCTLTSSIQSVTELSKFPETNSMMAMFASDCSKLVADISKLMTELQKDSSLKSKYHPMLIEEWRDFFAPSIYNMLLAHFIHCSSAFQDTKSIVLLYLLKYLSLGVGSVDGPILKSINLPPLYNSDDADCSLKLPDNLQFILNHLSPILLSFHPHCQSAAYILLDEVLVDVMAAWDEDALAADDKEETPTRPLPRAIQDTIEEAALVVDRTLANTEIGKTYEVPPHTQKYTSITGYLMAWLLLLKAMRKGREANTQLYASYIRESGLFFDLLNNLFKLMPLSPDISVSGSSKSENTMFNTPVDISTSVEASSGFISWLSCRVYFRCLTQLPAAIRAWWMNLDRSVQQYVDQYTTTHVSPILIVNEMNAINEATLKFDNMVIKSRPGVREIVAVYTIDEASMELVLRMAPNYPLSTVSLEDHKRVGVSIAQWRNWLFGLNTMLSHRNTPLVSSLAFWKSNVDQKFKGIEECYICYYVLHGSNHQIPKLLCRTCKKKFHAACLFKWFSTSNNSTCPICRSLF